MTPPFGGRLHAIEEVLPDPAAAGGVGHARVRLVLARPAGPQPAAGWAARLGDGHRHPHRVVAAAPRPRRESTSRRRSWPRALPLAGRGRQGLPGPGCSPGRSVGSASCPCSRRQVRSRRCSCSSPSSARHTGSEDPPPTSLSPARYCRRPRRRRARRRAAARPAAAPTALPCGPSRLTASGRRSSSITAEQTASPTSPSATTRTGSSPVPRSSCTWCGTGCAWSHPTRSDRPREWSETWLEFAEFVDQRVAGRDRRRAALVAAGLRGGRHAPDLYMGDEAIVDCQAFTLGGGYPIKSPARCYNRLVKKAGYIRRSSTTATARPRARGVARGP